MDCGLGWKWVPVDISPLDQVTCSTRYESLRVASKPQGSLDCYGDSEFGMISDNPKDSDSVSSCVEVPHRTVTLLDVITRSR